MNFYSQRRANLVRDFKKDGIDATLITGEHNVRYLTGFTGSSAYVIGTAKQFYIISDERYTDQIQEECQEIEIHIRTHNTTTLEATAELLAKLACKAVGIEADHVTLGFHQTLTSLTKTNFAPLSGKVESLRAVKDASEIEAIRTSVQIAERAFGMFRTMLRDSDTEKELADNMESYLRRAGANGSAFPTIIAIGERGALPHAVPTNKVLSDASKLLVDWGADCNGYKSDITRTLKSPFGILPNRRNKQERNGFDLDTIHDLLVRAQTAALEVIGVGALAKDVDAAARKVIGDAGYGEYFVHGLGHGIGLEIHEAPRIRENSDDTLQAGMVITLEPGIYIPGWGGVRVEDDVLVTREGGVLLTTLPHDTALLDFS